MVPLRLTVHNFMCYRDGVPTLDLEGIHVACLCGDNGHGKTALLDAITWALWGHARARTQEELVHQGQQDMAVELDFLARGQVYRASRRHSRSARSRQGATILELQVSSDNGFQPITGNSVRETEARISEILHMDYETFINTAFLRQGDADRFTTSTPANRKETLAEVLDLSYYQLLEERARDRSRFIQEKVRDLESAIALRQQQIAQKPQHEEELLVVTADLARLTPEVDADRLGVEELRRKVGTLLEGRKELDDMTRRLVDTERDIAQLERQVPNLEARVAEYEAALLREPEIREQYAKLEGSRAEFDRLDKALARRSDLNTEKAGLDREVAVQRERLSGQAAQLRKRIAEDLEPKANRIADIEEGFQLIPREQAELSNLETTHRQQLDKAQDIVARSRYLDESNGALLKEMEETRKKFDMLEQGDNLCPLCRQPLGTEGQQHLQREYETQGVDRKRRFQENASEKSELDRTHKELLAQTSGLEANLRNERQRIESSVARLEAERAESERAKVDLQQATVELGRVDKLIGAESYAIDERRRIAELEKEVAALGYDADRHQQTREWLQSLEGYADLYRKLEEAVSNLPTERESLETAHHMLSRRRQEVRDAQERKEALGRELKALPSLESNLEGAEKRFEALDKQRDEAMVKRGVLQQQIEQCKALESEVSQHEDRRRKLLDDKSVYDELAVAFGKNGIQALIIETTIPELESDANELLGRLTDNRMFVRLQLHEGRRDSRTGLPSEELDIRIADEVGTRSYETFSGGEAFRIDFALRIALSKLLARRSGAPLPILFIDEGFGSQDSQGQERLTEAIQSIQDDFEKIIVITHVEQIKEAFPVRIQVTKTGSGSTFTMV